ncbi:MAG: hypothetical protein HYZ88_01605 [Candidatus Omnitrophica bacterium]|nr:hypothetical protein [Candidatus Omnitrophota bacterium]
MSRTQIQQIVVVILLIAFGIVWIVSRQPSNPMPAVPAVTTPTGPSEQPEASEPRPPAPEISRDLFLPPDAFQQRIRQRELEQERQSQPPSAAPAPEAAAVDLSRFTVQGVFWGTSRPQAIINRKIVSVGDEIDGAKITSISKERILLELNGTEAELKPPPIRSLDRRGLSE